MGITGGRVTRDWQHSAGKQKATSAQANIQTHYTGGTLKTTPHSTQRLARWHSVTTNTLSFTPHDTQRSNAITVHRAHLNTHNTVHVITTDCCN